MLIRDQPNARGHLRSGTVVVLAWMARSDLGGLFNFMDDKMFTDGHAYTFMLVNEHVFVGDYFFDDGVGYGGHVDQDGRVDIHGRGIVVMSAMVAPRKQYHVDRRACSAQYGDHGCGLAHHVPNTCTDLAHA